MGENKNLEESIWELMIKHYSLCKDGDLDRHYMTTSYGTFTRREMLHEFEMRSEVAKKHIHQLFLLAENMMIRQIDQSREIPDVPSSDREKLQEGLDK